jgi:3-phenylpropionate/trans-cinnamate dioxygenase ferredoxin reductase subunit
MHAPAEARTKTETAVIVGAGVAGGRAAETLRAEGFAGRIVLIGAEPERPYERPPLSKGFLSGTVVDDDFFLRPAAFYAEQGIELRLGTRATALDPEARRVELASGERLAYDLLLIATGAAPRSLPVEGADLDGVYLLRTVADARRIRTMLETAQRVVVIGMGFIGAEVAATCRTLGKEVIALEAAGLPLASALGPEVATRLADVHRARGVDLRTGQVVQGLLGFDHVERVITEDGAVDCDLVVVGIGVVPEVGWLAGSGLALDDGVVVDAGYRTNLPGICAAGDVARQYHPRYGAYLRVEHFDAAGQGGALAARALLGQDTGDPPLPYFWSDQYDLSIQVAGVTTGCDEVVFRGNPGSGSWSAFYLRAGTFLGALAVNRFKDFSAARRLLAQGVPVGATELADEALELRALLSRGAR